MEQKTYDIDYYVVDKDQGSLVSAYMFYHNKASFSTQDETVVPNIGERIVYEFNGKTSLFKVVDVIYNIRKTHVYSSSIWDDKPLNIPQITAVAVILNYCD